MEKNLRPLSQAEDAMTDFVIEKDTLVRYRGTGGDVTVPSFIKHILDNAFYHHTKIDSITLPEGLISVGKHALSMTGVEELYLPDSVTSFGRGALSHCYRLLRLHLPVGLTVLSEGLLEGCGALEQITLPPQLCRIENRALSGCAALTSITLPETVEFIGQAVFWGCDRLERILCTERVAALIRPDLFNSMTFQNGTFVRKPIPKIEIL